jgi:hypothetical protein
MGREAAPLLSKKEIGTATQSIGDESPHYN